MQILYADESGSTGTDYDNKEQPIFVLGGVIVDKDKWHEINEKFDSEKQKILPILKEYEIHTNELFNSSKKSIFDKYDWKENLKVLEKIAEIIEKLDIKFTYILIDKAEMKKELKNKFDGKVKIDPYILAFCTTYVIFMSNLEENNKKGIIFLDEIIKIPEMLNNMYPTFNMYNKNIIEKAVFLKSKDTNFIQIADFWAFYVNKYTQITRGYKKYSEIKNEHCIKIFDKLNKKLLFGGYLDVHDIISKIK